MTQFEFMIFGIIALALIGIVAIIYFVYQARQKKQRKRDRHQNMSRDYSSPDSNIASVQKEDLKKWVTKTLSTPETKAPPTTANSRKSRRADKVMVDKKSVPPLPKKTAPPVQPKPAIESPVEPVQEVVTQGADLVVEDTNPELAEYDTGNDIQATLDSDEVSTKELADFLILALDSAESLGEIPDYIGDDDDFDDFDYFDDEPTGPAPAEIPDWLVDKMKIHPEAAPKSNTNPSANIENADNKPDSLPDWLRAGANQDSEDISPEVSDAIESLVKQKQASIAKKKRKH